MKFKSVEDELRERQTFIKARQLMADQKSLLRAMGADGVHYRYPSGSHEYLDKVSKALLDDDAESLGRLMIDQMVHYFWALAEKEVNAVEHTSSH